MDIEILVDGVLRKLRVRKKLATAMVQEEKLFSREVISKKISILFPSSMGFRDVPVRETRGIFPIPLSTLHAQIAVSSHIANYISTAGVAQGSLDYGFDPSFVASGPGSTQGIRIIDNYNTIAVSGSDRYIAIDIDFRQFDSNNIMTNYRLPLMRSLKKQSVKLSHYEYGRDKIKFFEMIDYAYGEGYVYNTYWDIGRRPYHVLLENSDVPKSIIRQFFKFIKMGEDIKKCKPLRGAKRMVAGKTYYVLNIEKKGWEKIVVMYSQFLLVDYRSDGQDLILLESEASGELLTLAFNSIVNYAMQRKIIEYIGQSDLSRVIRPVHLQVVGDDVEMICKIDKNSIYAKFCDELLAFLEEKYKMGGHVIAKFKSLLRLGGAEFVQTFAIMGMYCPRDYIQIIGSEKPRSIMDPISFLMSFKRLLLSKTARFFYESYAFLVLFLSWYKLTSKKKKRAIYLLIYSFK